MPNSVKELRELRGREVEAARAILKKAEDEHRDLTTEEKVNYDKAFEAQQRLKDQIEREERQRDAEREILEGRLARGEGGRENGRDERADAERDASEQRAIDEVLKRHQIDREKLSRSTQRRATAGYERDFRAYLSATTRHEEARALSAGLDSEGGYTVVPVQFSATLIKAVDDAVFVRRYASKETVESAAALGLTTLAADPADGDWTTEIQTGDEDSTMSFGRREQQPHPFAKRIKVSKKLLRASSRSIEALVTERLAYKAGVTEERAYLTGNGNQRPLGIFTASDDGIPTSRDVATDNQATEITGDGLINAKFALKGQYLREARWIFHRDAVKQITKLKDQNDQYLWLPSLREGEPDRILGIPYDMSEFAPNTFTTGQYVGALCAWRFYQIVDALGMTIQVLTELYAESNQNGYILRKETDGAPVLAEAFVRVTLG